MGSPDQVSFFLGDQRVTLFSFFYWGVIQSWNLKIDRVRILVMAQLVPLSYC